MVFAAAMHSVEGLRGEGASPVLQLYRQTYVNRPFGRLLTCVCPYEDAWPILPQAAGTEIKTALEIGLRGADVADQNYLISDGV